MITTINIRDVRENIQRRKRQFKRLGIQQAYISYVDSRRSKFNTDLKSKTCLSYEDGEFLLHTSFSHKVLKPDDIVVHSILKKIKNGDYEVISIGMIHQNYKNDGESGQ